MSAEPIAAASLIVMREGGAAPELLVVERATTLRFAGGATVFPGGRIDPDDLALADGDDDRAARIACVREVLEETGLALGIAPTPPHDLAADLRAALEGGAALSGLLATHGLALELDAMTPFARWRPDLEHRAFDTRFYLQPAAGGGPMPVPDGGEVVSAKWIAAAELLATADHGEARLIFPTRRLLERLARFASIAEAVADAARYPITTITPWIEPRDGAPHLCIPDGLGYPVIAEPLSRVQRG